MDHLNGALIKRLKNFVKHGIELVKDRASKSKDKKGVVIAE